MAGNARRGPHCIGILFLCQEWRQWGLFFAGRNFGMKLMLPPIRQNVFLVADHSAFLGLLTLQKGPIVPFSVTTPPFGRNGRFGGARRRCACSSPAVCPASRCALLVVCCLTLDAWCPPFVVWSLLPSAGLFALSFVARRPSAAVRCSMPGACHSVWPLPSACRRLRPLGSVARRLRPRPLRRSSRSAWRSLLCACETPPPFLCGRLLFLLPPHAESPLRLLRR